MPSPKLYGETAPDEGKRAFEAHLGKPFELGQPGQTGWHGGESSPYGVALDVRYPVCDPETLIAAATSPELPITGTPTHRMPTSSSSSSTA